MMVHGSPLSRLWFAADINQSKQAPVTSEYDRCDGAPLKIVHLERAGTSLT